MSIRENRLRRLHCLESGLGIPATIYYVYFCLFLMTMLYLCNQLNCSKILKCDVFVLQDGVGSERWMLLPKS